MPDYNLDVKAIKMINNVQKNADFFEGRENFLFMWGEDFAFGSAHRIFND
jgi:hypothetical protein